MAAARLIAAGLTVLLGAASPALAAPTIQRHPVYAGMEASFGDCPDEQPPPGASCTDNYVLVHRGYNVVGGGGLPASKAPWNVYAETALLEFTGRDEPEVTILRFGFGELPGTATVDRQHLGSATAQFSLPMSDGSTFTFAGRWEATSRRTVIGRYGPATGAPFHVVDRCRTFNAIGHQKYRTGVMTGTLDGEPVRSYASEFAAAIFDNSFRYIDVPHGGCAD